MDIYKDRIRPLFDGSGLSDREIALKIGIPVKLIYNWNNGVKSYNKYYSEIASAFEVSVAYLKGETDNPRKQDAENPPPVGDGLDAEFLQLMAKLTDQERDLVGAFAQGLLQNRKP